MDCYVGVEADSFVVSKYPKQLSFRFPSPDYYMQWGEANSDNFQSANEYCVSTTNLEKEELSPNEESSSNGFEVETSTHGESSTESTWYEGFPFLDQIQVNPEASLDMTRVLGNQPDYQLDGVTDQTDDIFLRSLLEETSGMENPYGGPVSMLPLPDHSMMPSNNLLMDIIEESQSVPKDVSTATVSKKITHCFPSLADWERLENTPHFMPSDSAKMKDCSMTKEPIVPGLTRAELHSPHKVNKHLSARRSLGESVLQELEMAMALLTKSTRLSCRDALYRLAKSSKQQNAGSQNQSGEITMEKHSLLTDHYKTSRFGRVNPTDCQTNTIDRTIEKLMFDNLDNISSSESVNLSKETVMTDSSSPTNGRNLIPVPLHPHWSLFPHDADVSILNGEKNTMIGFIEI